MVVRVVTHGAVEKLYLATHLAQFLDEDHLMNIVAGKSIWRREQQAIQLAIAGFVAQPVQPGASQRGPTVAIVTEDAILSQYPTLALHVAAQACKLLLNRLVLDLM